MHKEIKVQKLAVPLILVIVVALFSILTPNFRTWGNFITILRQVSMICILAVGMTGVLLTGGIDLSVGVQMGLCGMISSLLMVNYGLGILPACLIGVAATTMVGLINGLLITTTSMPPLIETLGMSNIVFGINYLVTGGYPVSGLPKGMSILGQGYLGFLPVSVVIMILVVAAGAFVLQKTCFGRYLYAIGNNEEAARLSAVNTKKMLVLVYVIQGALCGIAGLILLSRVNSGQPISGKNTEMDVITACVVGGVSTTGGEGHILGVIFGVLIIGVLSNGMAVLGMGEYWQMVLKGLVLVIAVGLDCIGKLHRSR